MLIESGYDRNKTQFLVDGFRKGFRIDCTTSPPSRLSGNLQSAKHHPETVSQKLIKEINAHRIAGPFSNPPFPNFVCSPLGVCPKKKPGTFRLIHHLSFPEGQSVNDGISEYASSVQYTTLSHAISQIKKLGRFVFNFVLICWPKTNLIKCFYCFLHLNTLLGKVKGVVYSSPAIF